MGKPAQPHAVIRTSLKRHSQKHQGIPPCHPPPWACPDPEQLTAIRGKGGEAAAGCRGSRGAAGCWGLLHPCYRSPSSPAKLHRVWAQLSSQGNAGGVGVPHLKVIAIRAMGAVQPLGLPACWRDAGPSP